MARAKLKTTDEEATVIEIRCTPSMKSPVYSVFAVFGNNHRYLGDPSKCDCPDGWLFCSHMLGHMLLFYVVQKRHAWSLTALELAMPEPIKSIQQLPIPAGLIFGELAVADRKLRQQIKVIGRALAKENPGYAAAVTDMLNDVSEVVGWSGFGTRARPLRPQ